MNDLYAPHVAEIKKALGDKISEETILEDLEKLVKYRVPVAEAKRSIIKKYGGTDSIKKSLSEITAEDRTVEITVKVLEANKREVDVKGTKRTIITGILADHTAQMPFTAWKELDLKKGDVINIKGAYVRSWQNQLQINLAERCEITPQDESAISEIKTEITPTKLKHVKSHSNNLHLLVTILESKEQTVHTKEGEKTIINGILADETAKLPFTAWVQSPLLTVNNTLHIENAYSKPFRGIPTINISEQTTLTPAKQTISPQNEPAQEELCELLKRDGALDVVVKGNILSVRPGSGLITRCPECKRVIQKNTCRVHGQVTPLTDMRVKSIIDDGTGSLTLVLDAKLTEQLWGHTIEEAKKMAADAMTPEVVEENIREQILGRTIASRGNMSNSEYGASLVAESAWFPKNNLEDEAIKLLTERGVNQ
jgi:replication factor A1